MKKDNCKHKRTKFMWEDPTRLILRKWNERYQRWEGGVFSHNIHKCKKCNVLVARVKPMYKDYVERNGYHE